MMIRVALYQKGLKAFKAEIDETELFAASQKGRAEESNARLGELAKKNRTFVADQAPRNRCQSYRAVRASIRAARSRLRIVDLFEPGVLVRPVVGLVIWYERQHSRIISENRHRTDEPIQHLHLRAAPYFLHLLCSHIGTSSNVFIAILITSTLPPQPVMAAVGVDLSETATGTRRERRQPPLFTNP